MSSALLIRLNGLLTSPIQSVVSVVLYESVTDLHDLRSSVMGLSRRDAPRRVAGPVLDSEEDRELPAHVHLGINFDSSRLWTDTDPC